MSTTRTRGQSSSGFLVTLTILISIGLVVCVIVLAVDSRLLWSGVPAQGTIVDVQATKCGKAADVRYVVRFTDRAGQVHTASFNRCDDRLPSNVSRGDSITILYLPGDPTMIAPPGGLLIHLQFFIGLAIFLVLCELLVLGVWIRKKWVAHHRVQV